MEASRPRRRSVSRPWSLTPPRTHARRTRRRRRPPSPGSSRTPLRREDGSAFPHRTWGHGSEKRQEFIHARRFRTRRGAVEGAALGSASSCTTPAHAYPQCFRLVTYRYSNVPGRSHPSTRPSNLGPGLKLTPCGFCDVLAFLQQQRCCIVRVCLQIIQNIL